MGDGSPIASSVDWLEGLLLGSISQLVAVIAVACFGLLMMQGRIDWRRGVRIIVGCFILFGAPVIAAGILTAAGSGGSAPGRIDGVEPMRSPTVAELPYQPSRQPGSICWTCGAD